MDRQLAKHVVFTGFRSGCLLQELVPLLKAHCEMGEYEQYSKAIAAVSAEISIEILTPLFKLYPDLKTEVDAAIEKYGQIIWRLSL